MRSNLSALAGALQQTDLFIKQIEDDGDAMPPEKAICLRHGNFIGELNR